MKHLVGSRVQLIISKEQTGHSLGTDLITEALRLSKYLFLAPSAPLRQHIANERGQAKFAHTGWHFLNLVITLAAVMMI